MKPLIVFAVLAMSFLLPAAGRAYCPPASRGWGSTVRVRIHDQLDDQLKHASGIVWTRLELEIAVERVLMRINASAGADTPWLFLDTTTLPSTCAWLDTNCSDGVDSPSLATTCALPNTIHLVPNNCGGAYWYTSTLPQPSHIIQFEKFLSGIPYVPPAPPPDMRYEHMPVGTNAALFEATLMHELGHAIGLDHPQACGWSTVCPSPLLPCAVMASDWGQTVSADYFMKDDSDALRSLSGNRIAPTESLRETNNLNIGFYDLSAGNFDAQGHFAASSRLGGSASNLTVVGYLRSIPTAPVVFTWDFATLAVTSLGAPNLYSGNGPLGAAQDLSQRYATSSTWRLTADSRRWGRRVVVSRRPLSGSGWTTTLSNPAQGALDDTVAGGVSSVYDAQSGQLLTALRTSNGTVLLQDYSASTFGAPFSTSIKSLTTPILACTTAVAPAKNCILVTVEAGRPVTTSATQRLQWTEFAWNAAANTWTPGALHTEPFLMWSDMSLTVHSLGTSWEFVVSYQLPSEVGNTTYLLRKAPGESNAFVLWGELTASSQETSVAFVGGFGDYVDAFNFVFP